MPFRYCCRLWQHFYDNLIKESIDAIILPLTYIINSITFGIVPKQLKITWVVPLFKSGDQDIFTNYRPVSVLPAFSKIVEKVMYNRLLRFVNNHNILSNNQYSFCKHHSTAYSLACLYGNKLKIRNTQLVFL